MRRIVFLLLILTIFFACKKEINPKLQEQQSSLNIIPIETDMSACRDELQPDWIADTIDVPTQLGAALVGNPYSVATMQQAAINLYGNDGDISANRKYIRYRPSTLEQLETLQNSDIELFDYPLDREVIEEGDYYPQPGIGENEIPWFYSVVDIGYQPLSGIQYEELAQLYVPDDDLYLENEAFRITGNPVESLDCSSDTLLLLNNISEDLISKVPGDVVPNVSACLEGYHWDNVLRRCVPNNCPEGYHWNGTTCVRDIVTPPPPPPAKRPAGQILVRDYINISGGYRDVPVRRTRVVCRRYFKVDRIYTDDQGRFTSSKYYHNKVKVFVKFKSTQLTTRGLRGARAWQALFPIKHGLGKYSGNLSNISWTYTSSQMGNSRANRNWWAAQVMNAYLEFNESATALNTGLLPSDMRILLTGWQDAAGAGSTPMNHHRDVWSPSDAYIRQFLVQPAGAWWGQAYNTLYNNNIVLRGMDMSLGYRTTSAWASDKVKELMYHELAHASHFNKVGQDWWSDLVYAESYEISRFGANNINSPYGTGDDGFLSDYISLAESWAEHFGQTIANRIYSSYSTSFVGQRTFTYNNDWPVAGLSSHLNYLEDFSPFRTNDPFRWIPDGLYYDLIDARNESSPVVDNVIGYTNQQLFNALEQDVKSLPGFRQRLLQQNGNNQATEITQTFAQYGY